MAEELRIAVTADARKMKTTVHADGHQFVSDERLRELAAKVDERCPVFATMKVSGIAMDSQWLRA